MSLYKMLMGRNPYGTYLMGALGFVQGAEQNASLGRFRDVYTNDAADRIFILHRNYGSDGEKYNKAIQSHPNYLAYIPDPQDYSYVVWEFSVPRQHCDLVRQIAALGDNTPLMDRYRKLINDMSNGVDNEATRNALEVGKKIMHAITEESEQVNEKIVEHGDGGVVVIGIRGKDEDK